MGFREFHGNDDVIARLREMLGRERFPHAVILAGPEGAGKYTLAQMLAKAMNCLNPPAGELRDFCGACANCTRIAQADDLETRFNEAVEAREGLKESEKKDTPLLIQTHPDVLVIPPDPPQLMIKVGQVRRLIANIYYRPSEAREKVTIFTCADFMKEAANSLLKVLEEPPDFATIFLLADNAGALLPTIRSRAVTFTLGALKTEEIEHYLAENRRELAPKARTLVARLSGGAIGKAKTFNLAGYTESRKDALVLLGTAITGADHTALFRTTEAYRAGADGAQKTDALLRATYSLLEDLLFLKSGTPELVRNVDITGELGKMAAQVEFEWLATAAQRLGEVESGMRRNLLRSLSLDAFASSLERA
jgi:DNA polymerase-3 subunit delta'